MGSVTNTVSDITAKSRYDTISEANDYYDL